MDNCCEIRRKFAEEFATAARLYSEMVVVLATSGISEQDYRRLCALTEAAQTRSESAFAAYEEHVDTHRCWNESSIVQNIASGRRYH
jgi:hypothetical protein